MEKLRREIEEAKNIDELFETLKGAPNSFLLILKTVISKKVNELKKIRSNAEKVSHNGSYSTKTDFKLANGNQVRVEVWLVTECTNANKLTYYNCNISTKGKGCRNWVFEFRSNHAKDSKILELISEKQLYTAYYNHWSKLNPIRIFANGSLNSELNRFTVKEKPQQLKHYIF